MHARYAPKGLSAASTMLTETVAPTGSSGSGNAARMASGSLSYCTVSADRSSVSFGWRGHKFEFIPGPSTWQGNWSLPTIDGKPIDIDPPFVYSSPHMSAKLDSDVVTASYGDYQLRYDFGDDTITLIS